MEKNAELKLRCKDKVKSVKGNTDRNVLVLIVINDHVNVI